MPLHKLRESIRAKLRAVSGFSLVELLVTTLILLLVTGIVTEGLPVVIRLYRRTVDIANAEAYLSTTMIALRSKLSLSNEVTENNRPVTVNGYPVYLDPETGYYIITNEKYGNPEDKGIWITYLKTDMNPRPLPNSPDPENPQPMSFPLIPEVQNDTSTLISGFDDITYENGSFKIKNLCVKKKGSSENDNPLAEIKGDEGDDGYIIVHTLNP